MKDLIITYTNKDVDSADSRPVTQDKKQHPEPPPYAIAKDGEDSRSLQARPGVSWYCENCYRDMGNPPKLEYGIKGGLCFCGSREAALRGHPITTKD